jgi:hypothetical protein
MYQKKYLMLLVSTLSQNRNFREAFLQCEYCVIHNRNSNCNKNETCTVFTHLQVFTLMMMVQGFLWYLFIVAIIVMILKGLGLLACSSFKLIFLYVSIWTVGRTFWIGDRPNTRPLLTQDNTTQKNADTHPCLEWDSNPQSQCLSGWRQYMPQTAQPLGLAWYMFTMLIKILKVFELFLGQMLCIPWLLAPFLCACIHTSYRRH